MLFKPLKKTSLQNRELADFRSFGKAKCLTLLETIMVEVDGTLFVRMTMFLPSRWCHFHLHVGEIDLLRVKWALGFDRHVGLVPMRNMNRQQTTLTISILLADVQPAYQSSDSQHKWKK